MNNYMRFWVLFISCIVIAAGAVPVHAADIKGSADHPLVPRYEGSEIVAYDTQAYAQKLFARSALKSGKLESNPDAALKLEAQRSEEHTSELQSRENLVCRLLLEKKKDL